MALLTGATAFTLAAEESTGLRAMRLSDGPTGVRGLKFSGRPGGRPVPERTVAPGRSARVTVSTDRRMWRTWNTEAARWDLLGPGGEYLIARGLGDVRATLPVR